MRLLPRLVALAFLLATPALAAPIPPGCEEDAVACKEDCTIEYGGNGNAIRKLTRCFEGCTSKRSQCARKFNAVNGRAPDAPEAAPERRQSKTEAAKLREIQEKDRKRDEDPFGDDDKPVRERPARDAYDDPPEPPPERKGYRASDEPEKKPVRGNPRPAAVPARASEPARPPPPPSPAVASEPEPTRSEPPDIEAFAEPPPRAEPPAPKPVVAEPAPSRDTSDDDDLPAPLPPVEKKAPPPRPVEAPRPKPPPEPKKDISDWDPNGD
ncbi:hypothetical protein G4177_15950 [Corallococcus sp. ZKHCc1 1396]|uniref:Uncharacterized protein n=1 Tax=Corallococcus soli TaxID=2710757 RepID=A0ABR9PNZ9_9BACT|nr:hypothetical protein [Corallococcus soli]MBE4749657.1 hypothetical protein [Corallococcus soli]